MRDLLKTPMPAGPVMETGAASFFFPPKATVVTEEMFRVPKHQRERRLLEMGAASSDYYRTTAAVGTDRTRIDVAEWLPFCAEKYKISDRLEDYVIAAMPIVPSDLPNRNLVAFPFRALTEFSPSQRMMQYKSWKAVPTFAEHDNKDHTKAKGVVLDVSLARMKNSADEVWKVMALCAYDRTKDAALANDILTGKRDEYSMGAWVTGYNCSCCGEFASSPNDPRCSHVDPKRSKLNVHQVGGKPVLAYWNVEAFSGFEISSVADGAFRGAKSNHLLRTNPDKVMK